MSALTTLITMVQTLVEMVKTLAMMVTILVMMVQTLILTVASLVRVATSLVLVAWTTMFVLFWDQIVSARTRVTAAGTVLLVDRAQVLPTWTFVAIVESLVKVAIREGQTAALVVSTLLLMVRTLCMMTGRSGQFILITVKMMARTDGSTAD